MNYFLMLLLVAVIIGLLAQASVKEFPGGLLGSTGVAFAGAWLGTFILGDWGPVIVNFPYVSASVGAVIFTLIMIVLSKLTHKTYDNH